MLEAMNRMFEQQAQMNKQIEQVMQRQNAIEDNVAPKRV
jgi:hypothetical protein